MPISGVVILTQPDRTQNVLTELQNMEQVTTYGIHKDFYIIAVLDSDSSKNLEKTTDDISQKISGVIGVYPAYVNFEENIENNDLS